MPAFGILVIDERDGCSHEQRVEGGNFFPEFDAVTVVGKSFAFDGADSDVVVPECIARSEITPEVTE